GFQWIDLHDSDNSTLTYFRRAKDPSDIVVCALNLTPVPREAYRMGVPTAGFYRELLNSDSEAYGGSNMGNGGGVQAEETPWHGQPFSVLITIPPLAAVFFKPV
nr:alpha amylase C-terminal domain-containing protein [Nitrospirales bacterium]